MRIREDGKSSYRTSVVEENQQLWGKSKTNSAMLAMEHAREDVSATRYATVSSTGC